MASQPVVLRFFGFRSRSSVRETKEPATEHPNEKNEVASPGTSDPPVSRAPESHDSSGAPTDSATTVDPAAQIQMRAPGAAPAVALSADSDQTDAKRPASAPRRFSWLPLAKKNSNEEPKPAVQAQDKKPKAGQENATPPVARTRSEKRALQSALLIRELITGPSSRSSAPNKSKARGPSKTDMEQVRAQLMQPKTANKVIAQLRQLSSSDEPVVVGTGPNGETLTALPKGPIHAVCLPCTDREAYDRHFAQLTKDAAKPSTAEHTVHVQSKTVTAEVASVANASFASVKTVFTEINLVSLITTPDLGLGGPPDGPGILSGALPTAKAIIDGFEQITPQLMALGYATGKAVIPDHTGVHPPTDRMSVITYWWGFEVVLPQPSLEYLDNVPSIAHAVVNFLTAMSLVEGGVREIIPFVRYISSFIDTEFSLVKQEDQGKGVVCAATWIMPAALVPRPWDFPQSPAKSESVPQSASASAFADGNGTVVSHTAPPPASSSAPAPAAADAPQPSSLNPAPVVNASSPEDKAEKEVVQDASPADDVPKVEVTPPTPTASQMVKQAEGETKAEGEAKANGDTEGGALPEPAAA
ncbi:hypothetical protein AcW1_009261 [Taiwanofungus camphoratus]|nr:hypothetical protein AcW1_009261 [Antrodia cinnamomea]